MFQMIQTLSRSPDCHTTQQRAHSGPSYREAKQGPKPPPGHPAHKPQTLSGCQALISYGIAVLSEPPKLTPLSA